jgi:hypothetical protein
MRWAAFERKIKRWERVVEKAHEEFAMRTMRILGRI